MFITEGDSANSESLFVDSKWIYCFRTDCRWMGGEVLLATNFCIGFRMNQVFVVRLNALIIFDALWIRPEAEPDTWTPEIIVIALRIISIQNDLHSCFNGISSVSARNLREVNMNGFESTAWRQRWLWVICLECRSFYWRVREVQNEIRLALGLMASELAAGAPP